MNIWASELGSTDSGIQETHTRFTLKMSTSSMPLMSRRSAFGVKMSPSARIFTDNSTAIAVTNT